MIKEITMYTVICDNCGKDSNDGTEYSCWSDEEQAETVADSAGWLLFEYGKHYCPDCVSYDDEDNLILKNLEKSTENLSKIKDKDEWLDELRGNNI